MSISLCSREEKMDRYVSDSFVQAYFGLAGIGVSRLWRGLSHEN